MEFPKSNITQILMDRVEFFITKEQNKSWFRVFYVWSDNYRFEIVGFAINTKS